MLALRFTTPSLNSAPSSILKSPFRFSPARTGKVPSGGESNLMKFSHETRFATPFNESPKKLPGAQCPHGTEGHAGACRDSFLWCKHIPVRVFCRSQVYISKCMKNSTREHFLCDKGASGPPTTFYKTKLRPFWGTHCHCGCWTVRTTMDSITVSIIWFVNT